MQPEKMQLTEKDKTWLNAAPVGHKIIEDRDKVNKLSQ